MKWHRTFLNSPAFPDCEQILDSLMQHIPGHVYWKNKKGIYLGCNDRQAQSLGLRQGSEVVGKTDFELPWCQALAKRLWDNDRQVLLTGKAHTIEEPALFDGKEALVLSLKVPLKDSEETVIGVMGISVDITQQKRVETKLIQAKEAAEAGYAAKIEFLANMRHDLRTPMAGIQGSIQVIRNYLEDPTKIEEAKDYLNYLETSSEALLTLLNHMLASIQAANGTLPVKKERFDLGEKLREVIQLNQARAKQKSLSLQVAHDQAIPILMGDGDRIQRIVLELVTNALNFTDQGEVNVISQLLARQASQIILKITVQDTGIGISSAEQVDLFSRFKRRNPAYQGTYSGMGLGLSIIKQFVEDLGGEIYLQSQSGQGSEFTCLLPLCAALLAEDNSKGLINPPATALPILGHQHKVEAISPEIPLAVLLVEDDAIVSKVMMKMLNNCHCQAVLAKDGATMLAKAKEASYALILLDIGLPDKSGYELAKAIRQDETNPNHSTPIVAVTAHIDSKTRKEVQVSGINALLSKPLAEQKLRELLQIFVLG
jgi:two-component system aerobic respiration control sensor histidine kinase ArcB